MIVLINYNKSCDIGEINIVCGTMILLLNQDILIESTNEYF